MPPEDTQHLKAQLRAQALANLRHLSAEQRQMASDQACGLLRRQTVWRIAQSVLFYAPRSDELDLSSLWREAISEGKAVALPQFNCESGAYRAAQIRNPDEPLVRGKYGIGEPGPGSRILPLNQLDLVLAPGVAFDLSGRRLGRGRGFYDRLLAQIGGTKCGVAFDQQVQAELPAEPHDVHVNFTLTPTRWLIFGQSPVVK